MRKFVGCGQGDAIEGAFAGAIGEIIDGVVTGHGDDSSGAATGFAEQQLAGMIAQKGGLGLSTMISAGLQRESSR